MSNSFNGDFTRPSPGRVLGIVRPIVKSSSPSPSMKDYRFFVEPISVMPEGFEEAEKYGFTGFMSRLGYGYNSFDSETEALTVLKKNFEHFYVSFSPCMKNHRYFVLDDLQKEGRLASVAEEAAYYPIPVFGNPETPVFGGDLNKFCRHMMEGKPLPGLSKKYWNNDIPCRLFVVATQNLEGKVGQWILFSPLSDDEFDGDVIAEGGAYFRVGDSALGYATLDMKDPSISSPILRLSSGPLWYAPTDFLPFLRAKLRPVPKDLDIFKDLGVERNPFASNQVETESEKSSASLAEISESLDQKRDQNAALRWEDEKQFSKDDTEAKRMEEFPDHLLFLPKITEKEFLNRLRETAQNLGFLYDQKDLLHFHTSLKSSRLTILSGSSGTGKSALVRLYGKALGLPDAQVRILPVKPSWMDDADILGYVDQKNMVYRSADTALSELLIEAASHPEKLYLVCFDEMNLARAEHYFAQFISILENKENPILRLYNPALSPRLYNSNVYPPEIPVGKNVLFVGTVNVDESTYRFSDKILDRANVLTLHQGKFKDWMHLSRKELPSYEELDTATFSYFYSYSASLSEREADFLDALNDAFLASGISCTIGYRTAEGIASYLDNLPQSEEISRGEGLDAQVVQRIFTKLRGSSSQLGTLLSENDRGELEGSLLPVLSKFKDLSSFASSEKMLAKKARELTLYDYTI